MLIPLGFWAASAGGGAAGTFELIEQRVLDSTESSVTFSSLSTYAADYQHLQLRVAARMTSTSTSGAIYFNGVQGTSYAWHSLVGEGSAVTTEQGSNQANMFIGQLGTSNNTSIFSANVIDILDPFETTKNTTIRSLNGRVNPAVFSTIRLNSGVFLSTDAVSSITFTDRLGASYAATSRFSIYGIRGG